MFIIPYKMETVFTRLPIVNICIIVITSLMFFLTIYESLPNDVIESLILQEWDLRQMIGNAFLHADLFHLVGNMLFLWIFGNAVCATVGNLAYPFLYLFLAICASSTHLTFDSHPAIGASGAVNGIIGMALILFPMNRLNCVYGYSMPMIGVFWKSGRFTTKTYWMILFWFVFDVFGLLLGGGNIAYWAHIGGFTVGLLTASSLLLFNVVETYDPTFIDIVTGKKLERQTYNLQELQEIAARQPGLPVQSSVSLASPSRHSSSSQAPTPMKEPMVIFRVTNVIQKENVITWFFINEGDALSDVAVQCGTPVVAEINPSRALPRRVTGWLRLKNGSFATPCEVKIGLSYAVASRRVNKQLVYRAEEKKFVAGPA